MRVIGLALVLLAGAQTTIRRDLPPGSWPILDLPMFKGMRPISASEYKTKESPYVVRVYRYTYRGDFKRELVRLRKFLPKRDGWVEKLEGRPDLISFERLIKDKKVRRQALLVMPGRWVPKPGVHSGVAPEAVPGWVRFSYNQELRDKPKP